MRKPLGSGCDEVRLDIALVRRGLVPSRERAQEALRAGMVRVNGPVSRPEHKVGATDALEVTGDAIGFL